MSVKATNFKEDLLFYLVKCGSLVLLACLLLGLLFTYPTEISDWLRASIHWIVATFMLVKDAFYVGYTYWSWLPFVVMAVLVIPFLLISCVCESMKKKYVLTEQYDRLDTVKVWLNLFSFIAVCLYAPVAPVPWVMGVVAYIFGMGSGCMRMMELQENESLREKASQE